MNEDSLPRHFGLDLVRVTEDTALASGRYMGSGNRDAADQAAAQAMYQALAEVDIDGHIVIGEEGKLDTHSPLDSGQSVGTGRGPAMDVVLDPIDGLGLLAESRPGAISVIAMARQGMMWSPYPAIYMEKLIVDEEVAPHLVPDCLDAPAAWTLALVARVKKKPVRDVVVFVLDRPRHADLIEELRSAGARVVLRSDGDIAGALMAASRHTGINLLMGIGGAPEGVIAACAVKCLRGGMLARLAPQSDAERRAVLAARLPLNEIMSSDKLVAGKDLFFSATGVTSGELLKGVHYEGDVVTTDSLVLRGRSGTWRRIYSEHRDPHELLD